MHNLHLQPDLTAPMKLRDIDLSRRDDCVNPDPANTVADRINTLLNSSGPGYAVKLCPNKQYILQSPLKFAAANQEISTEGYPTDNSRATLVVNGPVFNGTGHTTAVVGSCPTCSGIVLRNIQINGARRGAPITNGGANIEIGGGNANQTVQFVRSYDPRGWSCLHIAEGPLTCTNALIQNNDIGPCGNDNFMQWADGISLSCGDSVVRNNMIQGATDGGIVVFGSPGSQVYNNTIWVTNNTMLGGINMVDYLPWKGNYTNTVVRNNTIVGGYATSSDPANDKMGPNAANVFMKIGIAIGPRIWFGDRYFSNVSFSGVVEDNRFSGAFGYGIAISSTRNFTVENNTLFGNASFIGGKEGSNCSKTAPLPTPAAFIYDNTTSGVTLQPDFQLVPDAGGVTCIAPPLNGSYWPFGILPGTSTSSNASDSATSQAAPSSSKSSAASTAGVALGVLVGIVALGLVTWFIRRRVLRRIEDRKLYTETKEVMPGKGLGYVKHA